MAEYDFSDLRPRCGSRWIDCDTDDVMGGSGFWDSFKNGFSSFGNTVKNFVKSDTFKSGLNRVGNSDAFKSLVGTAGQAVNELTTGLSDMARARAQFEINKMKERQQMQEYERNLRYQIQMEKEKERLLKLEMELRGQPQVSPSFEIDEQSPVDSSPPPQKPTGPVLTDTGVPLSKKQRKRLRRQQQAGNGIGSTCKRICY